MVIVIEDEMRGRKDEVAVARWGTILLDFSVSGFRFKGLECVGARTWWRSRGRFQTFEGFRV